MVTLAAPRPKHRQASGTAASKGASRVSLRLLGGFELERNGRLIKLGRRKGEHLLAYLALNPGEQRREALAALLWGDLPEEQARASLRTALSALRHRAGENLLTVSRETIKLDPTASLWLDTLEFDRKVSLLMEGRGALPGGHDEPEAVRLYRGDLLPSSYDDWVLPLREGFRQRYLELLLFLTQAYRAHSDYERAAGYAERVLSQEPTNERAFQHLMFCYLMMGDRSAALEQYARCVEILRNELGAEPSGETTSLYQWIKQAAAGRPSLAGRLTNLPMPLSSFIGRKSETGQLKEMLSEGRLVTLTGVGGCGKTRLAIQAATDLLDTFKDGIWWVELGSIGNPALVPQALARVVGVRESADPTLSVTDLTLRYFRARQALVVLDNCEHVISASARLAKALLQSASGLRVLATSREPLGLPGEQVFRVPALSLPPAGAGQSAAGVAGAESLTLLVERASEAAPGFALTPETAPVAAKICARLDGMPLAIELAASRLSSLSLQQVADRLDHRFQLLKTGDRAGMSHHQTLEALFDWSYELLSEQERLLFRRLAVFSGGWTLEAAEAVCGQDGILPEAVLDLLDSLVQKSLVEAEICAGERRFGMHESVRAYASEKLYVVEKGTDLTSPLRLDSDETQALRERHLAYFIRLAEQAEQGLRGPEDLAWLQRLDADEENLRAALGWAFLELDVAPEAYLQLSSALRDYWLLRGQYGEGRRLLEAGLASTPDLPSQARARALCGMALLSGALGNVSESRAHIEAALKMARAIDAPRLIVEALYHHLVTGSGAVDDPVASRSYFAELLLRARAIRDEFYLAHAITWDAVVQPHEPGEALSMEEGALRMARTLGNARALAYALAGSATLYRTQGRYDKARQCQMEWLQLTDELGDLNGRAYVLNRLGRLSTMEGDLGSGRAFAEESLHIYRDLSAFASCARPLFTLGWNAMLRGDLARASTYLEESLSLRRLQGARYFLCGALIGLSRIALAQQDVPKAVRKLAEALDVVSDTGNHHWLAPCLETIGALANLRAMSAVTLQGAAAAVRETQSFAMPPAEQLAHEAIIQHLQEALPASAFSAAWAQGETMSAKQASDFARECLISELD